MHPVHFRKVGIAPVRPAIVGLAPRVLPLTPQVAFSSRSDDTLFDASRSVRILLRFRGHRRAFHPCAFRSDRSIRDSPSPFSPPGCDTGRLQRLRCARSAPLDGGPPHWLTVATIGFRRLCSLPVPKPWNLARHSVLQLVSPTRTTCLVASRVVAAHRLTSWSLDTGRNDPSRGSR
jgi:hypothetical protein